MSQETRRKNISTRICGRIASAHELNPLQGHPDSVTWSVKSVLQKIKLIKLHNQTSPFSSEGDYYEAFCYEF